MDFTHFSLLYPDRTEISAVRPDISMKVLEELGLSAVLNLSSCDMTEYLSSDPKVLAYRQETFTDLMNHPGLSNMLNRLLPVLSDVLELRRLDADSGDTESYLSCMTEIELYISCVQILHDGLTNAGGTLTSRAFRTLQSLVVELTESTYYQELNRKLAELTSRVREIRSITVGVNLDEQLRPRDAGVLSINDRPFTSGDTLDKILRLQFKNDAFTCIANLVPFGAKQNENQKTASAQAFRSAIEDVYRSSLHSWKKIVQMYVLENTEFLLGLLPEFELLVRGTEFMQTLHAKKCPMTVPVIYPMEERVFRATGLCNPCIAARIDTPVIPNDVVFDEKARIYILSGPNRGGKSVVTCAVGLAMVLFELGMYVPAEHAELSPVDALYTHFPTGADDTLDKGRLGEECARLSDIFSRVSENSMVLLDEALSSTGAYEASYIAAEVLAGLAHVGCRAIFCTHLHELSARLEDPEFRSRIAGCEPIDTLVAGVENGERSFKIYRQKPDGKSYAHDIAVKYGLTYRDIIQKITHK